MSDNTAALFRYTCSQEDSDVRPVWITPTASIRQQLHNEKHEALHPWSPRGIVACLTAGVYIFDVCGKDINYWLSRSASKVMLRHGTGIKKIGRAIDTPNHHLYRQHHGNPLERLFYGFFLPWHNMEYQLVIASSAQHARQATDFFYVAEENVAITGSPRNDLLFQVDEIISGDPALSWINDCHADNQKVFLYMPTFRDDKTPAFPYEWRQLDAICNRLNINVLVRLHPVDSSHSATKEISQLKHLRLHDKAADPYPLFRNIDCLITDYSSVVYDYMLLQKPVIFFCPDLQQYLSNSRSFYFDYNDVTPGPKPGNLEELESAMDVARNTTVDSSPYREAYQETLNHFHAYHDGLSTQRVHNEILGRFTVERT